MRSGVMRIGIVAGPRGVEIFLEPRTLHEVCLPVALDDIEITAVGSSARGLPSVSMKIDPHSLRGLSLLLSCDPVEFLRALEMARLGGIVPASAPRSLSDADAVQALIDCESTSKQGVVANLARRGLVLARRS